MPNTKQPITKMILFALGKMIGSSFTLAFDLAHFQSAYLKGGRTYVKLLKKELNQTRVKKAFFDLKYNKYIVIKKMGDKLILSLTPKGQFYLLRHQLTSATKKGDTGTLVVFDIPESQRLSRDQFRNWLKDCNFKMIQRSVWFSDRDVTKLLQQVVKHLKLSDWIRIFAVKSKI